MGVYLFLHKFLKFSCAPRKSRSSLPLAVLKPFQITRGRGSHSETVGKNQKVCGAHEMIGKPGRPVCVCVCERVCLQALEHFSRRRSMAFTACQWGRFGFRHLFGASVIWNLNAERKEVYWSRVQKVVWGDAAMKRRLRKSFRGLRVHGAGALQ